MAKQTINLGTSANKGDGDPLRTAFDKINDNFDELYAQDGNDVVLSAINASLIPDTDVAYDLGSASNRFRDLYLSGSTIDLGGTTLSVVGGELQLGGVKVPTTADVAASIASAVSAPTGDLTGSVFADDSSLMVDAINQTMFAETLTTLGVFGNPTLSLNADTIALDAQNGNLNLQTADTIVNTFVNGWEVNGINGASMVLNDDGVTSSELSIDVDVIDFGTGNTIDLQGNSVLFDGATVQNFAPGSIYAKNGQYLYVISASDGGTTTNVAFTYDTNISNVRQIIYGKTEFGNNGQAPIVDFTGASVTGLKVDSLFTVEESYSATPTTKFFEIETGAGNNRLLRTGVNMSAFAQEFGPEIDLTSYRSSPANGDAGPGLVLRASTGASVNDVIATIKTEVIDTTDGAVNSKLSFTTKTNGSSVTPLTIYGDTVDGSNVDMQGADVVWIGNPSGQVKLYGDVEFNDGTTTFVAANSVDFLCDVDLNGEVKFAKTTTTGDDDNPTLTLIDVNSSSVQVLTSNSTSTHNWELPDGSEGQIMHFVAGGAGGSGANHKIKINNWWKRDGDTGGWSSVTGYWDVFAIYGFAGRADTGMATAIFVDGAWRTTTPWVD